MQVTFESKGDFNELEKWLRKVSNNPPSIALAQIAKEGTASLAANTPRDTGETAGGWQAEIRTKPGESEIAWVNTAHPGTNVNLAVIIDQGHGTGTGGYVPPKPYIKRSMDGIFSRAGDKIAEEMIK